MFARLRRFLTLHPLVRDALLWAIPAMIFGAVLRIVLISYLPYAWWGADSRSYYSFAHKLITEGYISLDEKRRFLYPILMVPVSLLPGSPLRWLAVLQHALGVASLVPLAYIVRKTLVHWRLWIVPVTVVFAGLPVIVWYEHELLGENLFFAMLLWTFAGWCAWAGEERLARSRRLFWCFFTPFALFILTKPSGRFVWPGVLVGLVLIAAWRRLDWRRVAALGALMVVTLFVGSKKQGAWLLYVATFPLTQLDTPLHADYKAQIRDLVEPLRDHLDVYYLHDDLPFSFLESPRDYSDRPLWAALSGDEAVRRKLYMDLAIEGVKARPFAALQLAVERLVGSANMSTFGLDRFSGSYSRRRMEHSYAEAQKVEDSPLRMAFGLPKRGPLPPYAEFLDRLDPEPDAWRAILLQSYFERLARALKFYTMPEVPRSERRVSAARPTFLGCWLGVGVVCALLPRYRRTLGVWMLIGASYLFGVFLVSQLNARYFGPAWPVLIVLIAVPGDVLVQMIRGARPPTP